MDRAITNVIGTSCFSGTRAFVLLIALSLGVAFGQQPKDNRAKISIDEAKSANQQEVIARLFGTVNELKSEPDKPAAALLQSEIAEVLWKFDEPASRAIFRLAFDALRQMPADDSSSIDPTVKALSLRQTRRWATAIKTIVKRYGLHDRKSAEAWLKEFEDELKAQQTAAANSGRMSQAQAELLAEMALGEVSRDPQEAQRLGLLALKADEVPIAIPRLLMALRATNKTLSDVLFRQAFLEMSTRGFIYDPVLVSLANYAFFANGRPAPDMSSADERLVAQYFLDAASAQAARWRSGRSLARGEQASRGRFYVFLTSRALPIVALNAPSQLMLLQSNVAELGQGLSSDELQQADIQVSMLSQDSTSLEGKGDDLETRISSSRAGKE